MTQRQQQQRAVVVIDATAWSADVLLQFESARRTGAGGDAPVQQQHACHAGSMLQQQ
jgi:hypothetical protein